MLKVSVVGIFKQRKSDTVRGCSSNVTVRGQEKEARGQNTTEGSEATAWGKE